MCLKVAHDTLCSHLCKSTRESVSMDTLNVLGRYECTYDNEVTAGEFVRNVCVNLGIDPDTEDGVTRNASVWIQSREISGTAVRWKYRPNETLAESGLIDDTLLIFYEI